MDRAWKKPTQLSERNQMFYQWMELANALSNTAVDTGRTKKGTTSKKGEGTIEGRSTGFIMEVIQNVSTAQDSEVEVITEGKLSLVYGYFT